MIKSNAFNNEREIEGGRETLTSGNLTVTGRVAVTVAVVRFLAVGLHRTVARILGKATVSVSDDDLAWIRRTRCSPVCVLVRISPNKSKML